MHSVVLNAAGQTRPLTQASLAVGRMSIWHFFGLATRRSASPRSGPLHPMTFQDDFRGYLRRQEAGTSWQKGAKGLRKSALNFAL